MFTLSFIMPKFEGITLYQFNVKKKPVNNNR
jgi:hypothetical protein